MATQVARSVYQLESVGKDLAQAGQRCWFGRHTTVAANDVVQTGLRKVHMVVANLESDPVAGAQWVTAVAGVGGALNLKSWKATGTADTAPVAATTFSRVVNIIAIGE